MDKFIVRASVIVLNLHIFSSLILALNGIDNSDYDILFSNSLLFGIVLTVLCHSQGKYHCKWIRLLCYNLILVPLINFIDVKIGIFQDARCCIYTYAAFGIISVAITVYLAIKHFRRVNKVKSRYEHYVIKR